MRPTASVVMATCGWVTGKDRVRVASSSPSAVTYERSSGAGATPLRSVYCRHEPEKTALHGIVREHPGTFLARAGSKGRRIGVDTRSNPNVN